MTTSLKIKICLTTHFDKKFERLGRHCLTSLQRYAQRHGYNIELDNKIQSDRPASWNKIPLIQRLFQKGYDYVFWMDADALFVRFDQDIAEELEPDKDLYLAAIFNKKIITPNLGVMLIKNSDWSRKLLADMWQMEQYTNHLWWEQAAFLDICGLVKNLPPKWQSLFAESVRQKPNNQAILQKIKWLHLRWNNFGKYQERVPRPIIRHFTGRNYYWKLARMIYYGRLARLIKNNR